MSDFKMIIMNCQNCGYAYKLEDFKASSIWGAAKEDNLEVLKNARCPKCGWNNLLGRKIEKSEVKIMSERAVIKKIRKNLERFDERDKKILEMRFGFVGQKKHTMEEIGKKFNMTRAGISWRIQKIKREICSKQD